MELYILFDKKESIYIDNLIIVAHFKMIYIWRKINSVLFLYDRKDKI